MNFFSKAMIGLDLTEMDDNLIKKTAVFIKFLGIKKCYFLHVAKNLDVPSEILAQFPDLVAPIDESVEKIIQNKLIEYNFPQDIETEVLVEEGSHALDTFLRWAKLKDVDLIIMGRKDTLVGTGILADGVAKKAPCSVLLLQETRPVKFPKKILIPTDFSAHNNIIYEFAEELSRLLDAELVPMHIFDVPTGYSKTGKSLEEFTEIMKENAQTDFQKFSQKNNHENLHCEMILSEGKNPGTLILDFAREIDADIILLGSRGRTTSASILLGSTAEKLIQANKYLPMLIFKKKGETMGFFEALFRL